MPPHLVVTTRFISGVYISRVWDFFILILGERKGEGGRLNRSSPRRERKLLARHPQKITSQSLLAHIGSPVYPWTNPVELGIVKWSRFIALHTDALPFWATREAQIHLGRATDPSLRSVSPKHLDFARAAEQIKVKIVTKRLEVGFGKASTVSFRFSLFWESAPTTPAAPQDWGS